MSANRDTDVRRKTGFTSGIVGLGGAASGTSGGSKQAAQTTQTAEEYLQQTEDELNNRVDHGITGLADGFMDLIKLASNKDKNSFTAGEEAFQMDLRVQNMVRHTQTLMSLSHTLKILLLTADATSPERDRLLQEQSAKSAKDSQEAMDLVNQILHKMEQRQDQPSQAEQSEPRPV